jgi:hypothetical protein
LPEVLRPSKIAEPVDSEINQLGAGSDAVEHQGGRSWRTATLGRCGRSNGVVHIDSAGDRHSALVP